MTQTAARPYLQVSVQLDTPDAPPFDGKPVRGVSWTATRHDSGRVTYVVWAHHNNPGDALADRISKVAWMDDQLDPAMVPDWVPWPPANWLPSLELDQDQDRIAAMCDSIDAEVYHPEHFAAGVWK